MKSSLGLLTLAVVSTLALTGCPSGSDKSAQPVVQANVYNVIPNESCNVPATYPSSYTCTQTVNGIVLNTAAVAYSTIQELCTKLNDYQSNMDPARGGQAVAQQTRNHVYSQRCQGITNPGGPTGPITPIEGFKNFTCQLQTRNGNSVYQGQPEQLILSKNGDIREIALRAFVSKCNWLGCAQYPRTIGKLKVKFDAALTGSSSAMDKLTLSVENLDQDITTSVSGYAGSETKIEITPEDSESDRSTVIVSCRGTDSFVRSQIASNGLFQCKGEERVRGAKKSFNFTNQLSDVINSGISVTNSVFVQGSGDEVNYSQSLVNGYDDATVNLKSNLSSASSIRIEKLSSNYILKLDCQPK